MQKHPDYEEKINKLYIISKFPLSLVDSEGNTLYCCPDKSPYFLPKDLLIFFMNEYPKENLAKDIPFIYVSSEDIYIGMIPLPDGKYIVVGPSLSHPVSLLQTADKYSKYFNVEEISRLNDICLNSSRTDDILFSNFISTVYDLFYDSNISANDILKLNLNKKVLTSDKNTMQKIPDYSNMVFAIEDFSEYESKLMSAIKAGNQSSLEMILKRPIPIVLSNLKININTSLHVIVPFLTVFRLAAIDGGADYTEVFKLYDKIIKDISEKKTPMDCHLVVAEAASLFCSLVASTRGMGPYTTHAKKCEKYITSHIGEKITIKDLSLLCGVSERQISRIFSECFHTGVNQYIDSERIRLAKSMLVTSNYKIVEISNQLGYTSQSHFTRNFLKQTGCTPKEYRVRSKKAN